MGTLEISSVDHIFIEGLSIMNIHQMTLVLAVASLVSLTSGFITPVINGLTISLPLLGVSSTAGLSTVLAALGALKLGAAILLLASSEQEDEVVADAYGAPEVEEYAAPVVDEYGAPARYRQRRSAGGADRKSVMGLVAALDRSNCAKQMICQLSAKEEARLSSEERLVISLFGKEDRRYTSKTSVSEFGLAAKIGKASRSEAECQNFYQSCPYTSSQMMTFFKSL